MSHQINIDELITLLGLFPPDCTMWGWDDGFILFGEHGDGNDWGSIDPQCGSVFLTREYFKRTGRELPLYMSDAFYCDQTDYGYEWAFEAAINLLKFYGPFDKEIK